MSEPGSMGLARIVVLGVDSAIGGYMWWLSLYLLSRHLLPEGAASPPVARWREPWMAAGLSLAMAAVYAFGAAARLTASAPARYLTWFHLSWWAVPLATGLWLWAVIGLLRPPDRRPLWVLGLLLAMALLVAAVGTATDALFDAAAMRPATWTFDPYALPPAWPGYLLASAILGLALWWSALALWRHRRTGRGLWLLAAGNALFAAGTTIRLAGTYWLPDRLPEQVGGWIAALGLGTLGLGVVRHGALLSRRAMATDFGRSLRGAALVALASLLSLGVVFRLGGERVPPLAIPALIYLTVGIATPLSLYRFAIDRLTLPRWQSRFLLHLARVRHDVMTAPDPVRALERVGQELAAGVDLAQRGLMRDVVQAEVDRIFRHKAFHQDAVLADSRLHELPRVRVGLAVFAAENGLAPDQLSTAERARVLRRLLTDAIEHELCPAPGQAPPRPPSDRWLGYLILCKSYLEDKTRQEVIREIARETGVRLASVRETGGQVYARHLAAARAELADILWRANRQDA